MIWINTAPLLVLHFSQRYMFHKASSFNQDVSTWNTSSGTDFVSDLRAWDSAACWCHFRRRVFILLEHCRCCSWYHGCWQHGWCFVAHACNTIVVMHLERKLSNNLTIKHKSHPIILFYFTISSLLSSLWWSAGTIRHHYLFHTFVHRNKCFGDLRLSTKTCQAGTPLQQFLL